MKTLEQRRSDVFIVDCEDISHFALIVGTIAFNLL